MHLLTSLILFLGISFTLCRSVGYRHHSHISNPARHQADNSNEFFHLHQNHGREFPDERSDTQMRVSGHHEEELSTNAEGERHQDISDISEQDISDIFEGGEMELNRDQSNFLTNNDEVDKSLEQYMTNFYFDMINLFQYEIKEFAEKELHARQHRRKHRRPNLRPKRSLRSLLKDAHIKDILMRYFQQKQKEENGKPLLRYG